MRLSLPNRGVFVEAEVSEPMLSRLSSKTRFSESDEIAIMVMAYEKGLTQIDASGHNDPIAEMSRADDRDVSKAG